jgi:hypothetical protein
VLLVDVNYVEGVGRFGASAPYPLQDCQMSKYPTGYHLRNLLYVQMFGQGILKGEASLYH